VQLTTRIEKPHYRLLWRVETRLRCQYKKYATAFSKYLS